MPTSTHALAASLVAVLATPATAADEPGAWLQPTAYIDSRSPAIVDLAARLTAGTDAPRAQAVRIHDHVRDAIAFGWTRAFYQQTASEVLAAGVGYCNTKSTLFVALLRAAGIPARQHFVEIRADVLRGFVTPANRYVDHSYSEVWLDGGWQRVDSYIVDPPLLARAQATLRRENAALGYGVHVDGRADWDGHGDRFAQFVDNGRVADLAGRDYGVFADVGAFYADGRGNDRLSLLQGILIRLFIGGAQERVVAFRRGEG